MGKKYTDKAIGFNVIIEYEYLPKEIELASGIMWAVYSSEEEWKIDQHTHTIGTILDVGPTAFHHERYGWYVGVEGWEQPFKVGDNVRFKAHAGHQYREGRDSLGDQEGAWLTCCQDNDVLTIITSREEHEWPSEAEKREKAERAVQYRADKEAKEKEAESSVIVTRDNKIIA